MTSRWNVKDRMHRRLDRQFEALARISPKIRWAVSGLRQPRVALIRIPIGVLLVVGGLLSILPVFGLWMLPLGLLLLAVDVPLLRPAVTSVIIRLRRRVEIWRRRMRQRG